jgi:cytochrome c oxidase cbb3-type subunit 3
MAFALHRLVDILISDKDEMNFHWRTMHMKHIAILIGFIFLLGGTLPAQGQEPEVSPQKGEAVYKAHCVGCHGSQGKGDGLDAAKLIVPPANFHRPESRAKSEMDLRGAIIWGLAFRPMHGWWGKLSGDEMRSVTAYIRQLAPYQPSIP